MYPRRVAPLLGELSALLTEGLHPFTFRFYIVFGVGVSPDVYAFWLILSFVNPSVTASCDSSPKRWSLPLQRFLLIAFSPQAIIFHSRWWGGLRVPSSCGSSFRGACEAALSFYYFFSASDNLSLAVVGWFACTPVVFF